MSRELREDFQNLLDFFNNYNLRDVEFTGDLRAYLSSQHKKYFAYLTFIAEIIEINKRLEIDPSVNNKQIDYLTESCSDIGNSIFLMINGAYKPTKMMLRSSIETFIKGFNLDKIRDLDKEKSVYTIFDKVKGLDFFKDGNPIIILNSIQSEYKELCKDIHTATSSNMAHITALEYFPSIDLETIKNINHTSIKLEKNYLDLIAIKLKTYLKYMHHRNKEIIISNVSRKYRRELFGIND